MYNLYLYMSLVKEECILLKKHFIYNRVSNSNCFEGQMKTY